MVARSILIRQLKQPELRQTLCRAASSAPQRKQVQQKVPAATQPQASLKYTKPPPERSWLTEKVQASPVAKRFFLGLATVLGYNSNKQVAARRAYAMYETLCASKADEEKMFWQDGCRLPPTFQSWFTITNLHVWLLTVRLRALPDPHSRYYVQSLLDHFFIDVEERVRAVLQPDTRARLIAKSGATSSERQNLPTTEFYTLPNSDNRPRGNAPERLVVRQMKIFKEQWTGMGMSFDLGLVRGDAELASAIWRNFLGARGARGIVYPSSSNKPAFRRSINLVGGEIEKVADLDKKGLEKEEARDDGSGVHDFVAEEAGLYIEYPELMADITRYVRKELVRLEGIPDTQILGKADFVEVLRFGKIRG